MAQAGAAQSQGAPAQAKGNGCGPLFLCPWGSLHHRFDPGLSPVAGTRDFLPRIDRSHGRRDRGGPSKRGLLGLRLHSRDCVLDVSVLALQLLRGSEERRGQRAEDGLPSLPSSQPAFCHSAVPGSVTNPAACSYRHTRTNHYQAQAHMRVTVWSF